MRKSTKHCLAQIKWAINVTLTAAAKSLQSGPTLCDPMDSSPLGSSVHGILQARVLEWGSIYGHVEFGMKRMANSFFALVTAYPEGYIWFSLVPSFKGA